VRDGVRDGARPALVSQMPNSSQKLDLRLPWERNALRRIATLRHPAARGRQKLRSILRVSRIGGQFAPAAYHATGGLWRAAAPRVMACELLPLART
jgi:hypothetical protein